MKDDISEEATGHRPARMRLRIRVLIFGVSLVLLLLNVLGLIVLEEWSVGPGRFEKAIRFAFEAAVPVLALMSGFALVWIFIPAEEAPRALSVSGRSKRQS